MKIFLILICSTYLFAHKVNLFAISQDNGILIKSYFKKDEPCKNCEINIYNDKHEKIFTSFTDELGETVAKLNTTSLLEIEVVASMGHKNKISFQNSHVNSESEIKTESEHFQLSKEELRNIISSEINLAIKPLLEKDENSLEKIVSAIGYIFGIFGLIMLFTRKRQ